MTVTYTWELYCLYISFSSVFHFLGKSIGRQFKKKNVLSFYTLPTDPLKTVFVMKPRILTFGNSAVNSINWSNFYFPRTAIIFSEKGFCHSRELPHSSSRVFYRSNLGFVLITVLYGIPSPWLLRIVTLAWVQIIAYAYNIAIDFAYWPL